MHGFTSAGIVLVLFKLIGAETQILGLEAKLGLHGGGGVLILLVENRRLLRELLGCLLIAAGVCFGQGFILGDGRLRYGPEEILETFYNLQIIKGIEVSLDYQAINHPAYNRDRGPVSVGAVRVHFEY